MRGEREVAVERLLGELRALLNGNGEGRVSATQSACETCAKKTGNHACGRYFVAEATDRELETRRRALGRVRLHLEAAGEQLDRAFENAEILGERMGL